MDNAPLTFGPPQTLDSLLMPGTSLKKDHQLIQIPFDQYPSGRTVVDDMGLGKTIQAIALIGTSKGQLITNPQCSMPTSRDHQLAIRNIQAYSGWSTASQHLPWPHWSLII
ncbi:hypothetical protein O181_068350 [Austropuccinia psidii MF-1]|uniref:SNF2 N-terminal domain-containing protein n=1 Tax=Austropuccinia psidii MF-1 TaxID=1389203 RepID=A0A9Q3F0U7_9BASI|nr:hypothetical protein [Austropuccinia psidii MF-1]